MAGHTRGANKALHPTRPSVSIPWLVAIWRRSVCGLGTSAAAGPRGERRALGRPGSEPVGSSRVTVDAVTLDRRGLLLAAAVLAGATLWPWTARSESERTRVILLGTGGGPRPRRASSAAAQVIVSNGAAYVVDCGDGVARQLVLAGLNLASLRHIFITHHHSDHNA